MRGHLLILQKKWDVELLESEQHMWLECKNNGQALAWEMVKDTWRKTTTRNWPDTSMDLIRGAAAIPFEDEHSKDSERAHTLISMAIWSIWNSRNKHSINNQAVVPNEIREALKDILSDLMRKSWNATLFMEGGRRWTRQRELQAFWADKLFTNFDHKTGRIVDLSQRGVAGLTGVGGF